MHYALGYIMPTTDPRPYKCYRALLNPYCTDICILQVCSQSSWQIRDSVQTLLLMFITCVVHFVWKN